VRLPTAIQFQEMDPGPDVSEALAQRSAQDQSTLISVSHTARPGFRFKATVADHSPPNTVFCAYDWSIHNLPCGVGWDGLGLWNPVCLRESGTNSLFGRWGFGSTSARQQSLSQHAHVKNLVTSRLPEPRSEKCSLPSDLPQRWARLIRCVHINFQRTRVAG
jgi:hypothetical protein